MKSKIEITPEEFKDLCIYLIVDMKIRDVYVLIGMLGGLLFNDDPRA